MVCDSTAISDGKGCGAIPYGHLDTMHCVVKCTFVGTVLRMVLISDGSGGDTMEREGMDCSNEGVARRSC